MSAAQMSLTGRPDQVRAVLAAIRDGRPVELSLVRDAVALDAHTVSVQVDVRVCAAGRAAA